MTVLRALAQSGYPSTSHQQFLPRQVLWSKEPLNLPDYDYDTYMKDDQALYRLINQLRTEGLAFVTNIPGLEESLATIATRIGPIKDTFYGYTWDGMYLDARASIIGLANEHNSPNCTGRNQRCVHV